jgi:elongator complex protein 3
MRLEKIVKKLLKEKPKNQKELSDFKRKVAKIFKIEIPSNFVLLSLYQKLLEKGKIKKDEKIERLLKKKPIRSLSGIVNVSVLTKPYFCPGRCIFCPTEKDFPKSYLSGEPAAERAKSLKFDPFSQVKHRIEILKKAGHPTDKIELRIVGGTWSCYPRVYRENFIKKCFDGANGKKSKNLKEAQRKNEKAKNRIVGISIETRPDFINEKEIRFLRELGVTMVELGVQTVFDDILEKNQTGVNAQIIARATKLLKDAGFKVLYHIMPNLPGSNLERDFECFKILFTDERFKPDWLKIYPTVVIKGSSLYKIWQQKKYKPYSDKELVELLIKIKTLLPFWVRVARIQRDIPATKIIAGCKISNLREIIQREMEKRKLKCKCIRCREVKEKYNREEKVYLFREDYEASGGMEIFLSFGNKNRTKLYSFLRLRIPKENFKPIFSVLRNSAIIREIQTFGELVPIGEKNLAPQHGRLGKKLIKEAEKIVKREFKLNKVVVIAGVGVRNYFRLIGYKLKDTYMVKKI